MANPLDAFKDLKPWQQAAVAAGGVGVVGVVVWQKVKAKKAVPVTPPTATAAATSGGTAGEIEDPTTGQYYPDDSDDPETGLSYQQEITEYGSVSAADAASSGVGDQAALQGEDPSEYEEQIGETPASTGSTVTTNAQWMAEVETGLSEQNYTASDIGQGLAAYFASKPLGTSSDGTNLYTMMNLAISEYGPPPTGSYPLLIGSSTSPTTTGTTTAGTTTAAATASGGHVVSVNNNDAVVAWTGNAPKYKVVINGPGFSNKTTTTAETTADFSGLQAGHDYVVTVTPYNAAGQAGVSGEINVKTTK